MKKLLLLCFVAALGLNAAHADIVIDETSYTADTLMRRVIGPGITHTIVRIPDYPLNVYILETDLNNPNNRVETTIGYNTVGRTESLANAYKRNRTATKRPVAGCNANFWTVSGNGAPLNVYGMGAPLGGCVRNDTTMVNCNNHFDQWDGGPTRTAAAAITHDKTLYLGSMIWSGSITSSKLAQSLEYYNINRRCVAGEIALWGPAYTRTREFEDNWTAYNTQGDNQTDNYYLSFVEGSGWNVNGTMTCTVAAIVKAADRQTLGDYDACLTVTGDDNKTAMEALAVGDTLQLTCAWRTNDADAGYVYPDIENLVEGNAPILHNGELTSRNYDETYNTQVYSRTCYGASADGKHLYMLVIDKSVSPLYGRSAGCPTAAACQILKQLCPDVSEMVNMDAGGSAEMLVRGSIVNTTTEGTPRAVACGWFIEAVGEEDNTIASIAFADYRLQVPAYSSLTPKILGYNKLGELIDEDVKGFTLSCDAAIGTAADSVFVAGATEATGTLTATLNGMTATIQVNVMDAQPAIALRPIVIDTREYPVEVTATVAGNTYNYDPTLLTWAVDDEAVATITNGTLQGVSNGETIIRCDIGSLTDADTVIVEISPSPYLYQGYDEWTLKGSGAKSITIDETTGEISYTYSASRAPYLMLNKEITFFSLPDTVGLVFNSSVPIDYVQIDARNRFFTASNYLKISPDSIFEAGVDHRITLDLDALGGADYVGTYPITIKSIKFAINKSATAGEQTMWLRSFYAHYANVKAPQTGDVNADGEVNIADVNALISIILGNSTEDDYAGVADVNADAEINIADVNAVIAIILGN